MGSIHEECGVFGVWSREPEALGVLCYYGLYALQHRGQESARIVLIDDSIVRGTTCRRTIEMLKRAGAREIHMRVSAPPFIAPCFYGTDIDSPENLIANRHSVEEIAEIIGVTSLGYLSLGHTEALGAKCGGVCMACFDGCYPTEVPSHGAKRRFEQKIHRKKEG